MLRLLLLSALVFNNANGQFVWPLHSAVTDLAAGPEDAVHCRLTSPAGTAAFDSFGQCRVNIDRVTADHEGLWTVEVNQPNSMLPVTQTFTARVTSTVTAKPVVTTEVVAEKPLVSLTCRVASADVIQGCIFRGPGGLVLQARSGVAEDRFSFIERRETGSLTLTSNTATYYKIQIPEDDRVIEAQKLRDFVNLAIFQTGVQSCGLQINNPLTSDLGLWRCDMQTASETYYGHIMVLCPWAMQDPEIAASVISEPTLTSQMNNVAVIEGESVTMSCSVQSAIRYCYFRAQNGSIFTVSPGTSSPSLEYAGAGFDAGECGARFNALIRTDSGAWSCHVGFAHGDEQRASIVVEVEEELSASQYPEHHDLVIQGVVRGGAALDYCRFVRIDGTGFTTVNLPTGYTDSSSLTQGLCRIRVASPTILDHHPWTVVAKVTGRDDELAQSTEHTLEPPHPGHGGPDPRWWIYVTVTVVALVGLLAVFSCKRHRRWAAERVASVRKSMRKEPVRDEKPPLPA